MIIPSNGKMFSCLLFLFACDKAGRINVKNIILRVLLLALNICKFFFFSFEEAIQRKRMTPFPFILCSNASSKILAIVASLF